MPTVLIIDDEQNILVTLARALQLEGYRTEVAGSGKLGLEKAESLDVDLVMLDVMLPDIDGIEVLQKLRSGERDLPVVMMSGHATVEIAVRAVQLGAADFLEKPLSSDKVLVTVANALKLRRLTAENRDLRTLAGLSSRMLGSSAAMREVWEQIDLVAPSNGRVLITGENGTGKELVARAIHDRSDRRQGPFIKLNCAAVPAELIESELFGHEKGSFTGAHQMRRGKFELADGGTLFLDEVGDMPLAMQAKLLRVLQEGELERVGSCETLRVDARVISATNQDLEAAISSDRFRRDLYYRLNVVPIHLPPLRERKEDLPELAEFFLHLACQQNKRREKSFAPGAIEALAEHDYPGNVRELKNSVERLAIMVPDEVVGPADVRRVLHWGQAAPDRDSSADRFYDRSRSLREMVTEAERACIQLALRDCDGHVTNAARQLQLERSHLYKKMKSLGLK
ncbi:MAG: sigma-54-dependent Fis family transcriptional regulator [Deltaproteobacteria bacterium]|nr:sigma-54-dependent Fis family transcriptional regulator [Deltaproteobacteria bacterium]